MISRFLLGNNKRMNRDTCIIFLTFLVIEQNINIVKCAFICNSFSDSVLEVNFEGKSNLEERITALEEKVRQLQRLAVIEFGNASSLHKNSVPADCADIYDNGVHVDGVYLISPDGRCPFRVFCDMTHGGWTLIQRRQDGSVNFYRPWDDYVTGFGDVDGEHWLGLDKIHRLTKAGTQLYFHMENYDGSHDHAHYKAFTVHDVTTAYKMNVDVFGYNGSISETFSYHNDMKFSTFDNDNDKRSVNCCENADGGGWWFNTCWRYNLNGVYGKRADGGIAYYPGPKYVKNTHIKIRRRQGLC